MTEQATAASSRTLVRAGLVVTGAYLASRILGWIRTAALLAVFGAGRDLDAYLAAFRIPDAIFQLVAAGALGSALIPVLAGFFHEGRQSEAWRLVSSVVNLMLAALAALAVVFFVAAPRIMPLITQDFTAQQLDLAVRLSRIMLLSPILLAVSAVATSVLNAGNRFTAAAVAPLLYNLAIIVPVVLLGTSMGVTAAAVGVVARRPAQPARPGHAGRRNGISLPDDRRRVRPRDSRGHSARGATGARPRRHADHVHREHAARVRPRCRTHQRLHRGVHCLPDSRSV